jgi:Cof subfamily protein (haloacid dehalogenase superfamily)
VTSAIVLDLDGTLLNSNKEVSNRNLNAVLRCCELGLKVIIATARPPRSVKKFVPEEILRHCSFVYYNGALVVDKHYGIEKHISISNIETSNIVDYFSKTSPNCKISVEIQDKWYTNREIIDSTIFNLDVGPTVLETEQLKQLDATKILITDFELTRDLKLFEEKLNIVKTDAGNLIQIMNREVSKIKGITILCEAYGINLSEVIVFGDDYNDIDMFQSVGYSVAMLNGIEELKRIASEVTETNDNDGVAIVLERITER